MSFKVSNHKVASINALLLVGINLVKRLSIESILIYSAVHNGSNIESRKIHSLPYYYFLSTTTVYFVM